MNQATKPATPVMGQGASALARAAEPSPMMAQYLEIKAAYPDCLLFYRMGDFYELFFDDAEIASRALGIVLTKRGKHEGDDIPMCGVPIERADDYLQRLIAQGPSRRGLRATRRPGRGEEARRQIGRQARRRAPRHAGHDHRGAPARAWPRQPAARRPAREDGRGAFGLRPRRARHLDRRFHAERDRRSRPRPSRSRASSRARSSRRRALFDDPAFARLIAETRIATTPLAREAATPLGGAAGAASSMASRRWTASAPFSRAEIAAAALALGYRQAHADRRDAASRPACRAARAAQASRSTPRRAPISN